MAASGVTEQVRWRDTGADLARALGTDADVVARLAGPQPAGPARSQRALAWRLARPVLIALALIGPALALWTFSVRQADLRERQAADAEQALERWANSLNAQTLAYAEALQATRDFFDCSELVRREEFALFTAQLLERHPALRWVAWAPAVPRSERERLELEGLADVPGAERPQRVWNAADAPPQAPSAADHHPILFAVPATLERALLGLDLRGDALRARLLERALTSEAPVLSDPLAIAPGDGPASGVLMALRVGASGDGAHGPPGPAPRTQGARGVLLLGLRLDDLLARAALHLGGDRAAQLRPALAARQAEGRDLPMGAWRVTQVLRGAQGEAAGDGLEVQTRLEVCGQHWSLYGRPSAAFLAGGPQDSPGWVAAGALLGWELLLAATAALVAGWHGTLMRRQSALVDHVLQNLDEAVVVADRKGRIRVANRAAISVLGVPVDEQGQPRWPARLLFGRCGVDGRDGAAERVAPVQPLERAIAGEDVPESTYTLQVPYATAPREVSVSGHPVVDEGGALHGGMLVIRDVTERLALQKKAVAMELAGALQQRQFPKAPPQGLDLDLAGTVRAAEETSGDGYDWMLAPDGRLVLSVTDVRDHGLRAAMQMVSARAYLRSQVAAGSAPDRALAQVNASLVAELAPEDFVTLLCVEVDPATRRVRYANAGHPEGLVLGPDGSVEARLEATGPLLGVMERARYRLAEAPPLLPGRTLVLLTDGVLECADRRGRRFEEARLLQVLARHGRRRAKDIVEAVLAAVREFAGEGPPQDDLTVVVLKG